MVSNIEVKLQITDYKSSYILKRWTRLLNVVEFSNNRSKSNRRRSDNPIWDTTTTKMKWCKETVYL
jgi:hypothetical protein